MADCRVISVKNGEPEQSDSDNPAPSSSIQPGVRYCIESKVSVSPKELAFGFVCAELGIGHWYLQQKGVCAWHVCGSSLEIPHRTAPNFAPISSNVNALHHRKPVRVVVFLGKPPGPNIWTLDALELIIWILPLRHRFHNRRMTSPINWKTESRLVSHASIGGVTNAEYVVYSALRSASELSFDWKPPSFSNVLNQVLDPTVSGTKTLKSNTVAGALNSPFGLLNWENVSGIFWLLRFIRVTTMFDVILL